MTSPWQDLAERCEGAAATNYDLGFQMKKAIGWAPDVWDPTYHVGATIALVEERMPGHPWGVTRAVGGRITANVGYQPEGKGWHYTVSNAATPALALCAVFCRCMAEREKAGG